MNDIVRRVPDQAASITLAVLDPMGRSLGQLGQALLAEPQQVERTCHRPAGTRWRTDIPPSGESG